MHRLAQTCVLLVIVCWATVSLAAAVPELICDPLIQNRCAPVSKLLDGGYGLQVTCDNCGSSGSSGGGLTNTELRATPVPVSAASLPLPTGASTSAAQTDGTQKAITRGGAKGATAAADLTGTAEGADHQAADVQLYSGGTAYKGIAPGDAVDVNDRAARLLGKADVLVGAAAPSATNPLFVRLTDGTTTYVGFKSGDVIGALPAGGALIGAVKFSQTTSDNDVDVLTLPANATVDVNRIAGTTTLTGSGATGAGSIRTTAATDSPTYGTANGTIPTQSALSSSRAVAYGSSPTAVSAGNNGPAIADLEGRPYVNTGHPRTINCFVSTTATTSTQITGCEVVASNSIYITFAQLCGDIANATATAATLQSGTSTTCTGPHIIAAAYHAALGCVTWDIGMPGIKTTVAEGLCILDGVTGTKKATVVGYVAP